MFENFNEGAAAEICTLHVVARRAIVLVRIDFFVLLLSSGSTAHKKRTAGNEFGKHDFSDISITGWFQMSCGHEARKNMSHVCYERGPQKPKLDENAMV